MLISVFDISLFQCVVKLEKFRLSKHYASNAYELNFICCILTITFKINHYDILCNFGNNESSTINKLMRVLYYIVIRDIHICYSSLDFHYCKMNCLNIYYS